MKTDWMRGKYKRAMSFAGSLLFCIFRMQIEFVFLINHAIIRVEY